MENWAVIHPPEGTFGVPQIDVGAVKRKFLDVSYAGESPNQTLDIFLPPEGEGPFPTLIYVHGGGFYLGDKRDAQLHCAYDGINHGYAVVSVGYRLAGEAKYPAGLFDVKAAIRFLRANAVKYSLDGDRFGSCGDSAGGFYVIMAAATQGNLAFEDLSLGNVHYSSAVQSVVSWFGVFDIVALYEENAKLSDPNPSFPDMDVKLFGAQSTEIRGLMHFTNPNHFITPSFPPVYILHGAEDQTVPVSQAYQLEERVRQLCGKGRVKLEIMEGYGHGGVEPRWNDEENNDKVLAFFDKHLK